MVSLQGLVVETLRVMEKTPQLLKIFDGLLFKAPKNRHRIIAYGHHQKNQKNLAALA